MESPIEPIVAKFLSHKHKNILEISSSHNIEHNFKSVDSRTIYHINQELEKKRLSNDEIDIVSNCFKCQYIIRHDLKDSIGLVKKKQVFIIKLIETKQFEYGLRELENLSQFLNKVFNNLPVNWSKLRSGLELMEGLSFKEIQVKELLQSLNSLDRAQIINLVISFHFLILQCLLQYISINLNNLKMGKNQYLKYSIFKSICDFYLSKANFFRWLELAPESALAQKYNKNNEKILRGYIKLINFLHKKTHNSELITYKSCLILKLLLITNDIELIDQIIFNDKILPFIEEMKNSSNPCFDIVLRKSPSFTPNKYLKDLSAFTNDPSEEKLVSIKMNLISTSKKIVNDSEYLKLIRSYRLIQNSITLSFINTVCQYFESGLNENEINESHIEILDSFIAFIKDWGKECRNYPSINETLEFIFNIYSKSKQIRGMRAVSSILYTLGDNLSMLDFWIKLLECEYKISEAHSENEYFDTYKKRVYKVCNSLHQAKRFKESLTCLEKIIINFDHEVLNTTDVFGKLTCLQDSLFIRIIINNLSLSNQSVIYLFNGTVISDDLKTILLIRIFDCLEKANNFKDRVDFTNNLISSMKVENKYFKYLAYYHYYNLNYINEFIDFNIDEDTEHPLILSGVFLLKAIHLDQFEDSIVKSLNSFEIFCNQNDYQALNNYENEILRNLVNFLLLHDLNGYIICIVNKYLGYRGDIIKENRNLYFYLLVLLCSAVLKLRIPKSFSDHIIRLNTDMKELSCTSIKDVINFNLFQLEYCLLIGNNVLAREKFRKILNLIKSREDFDVTSKIKTSMSERFQNLLVVSKFQLLTSNLNYCMGNYEEAFSSVKISIKLLYSIIKTLDVHNIDKVYYNEIKWAAIKLMFSSYGEMLKNLKQMGITRDLLFYLLEFSKLDSSVYLPIVNCYNIQELILYNYVLQRSKECETLMVRYNQRRANKFVIKDFNLNFNYNEICKLERKEYLELLPYSFNSLEEISIDDLKNLSILHNTFEFDLLYVRTLSQPTITKKSLQIMNHDINRKIIKIMMEIKLKLFENHQLKGNNRCLSIAYFNLQGNQRLTAPDLKLINELLSFKDTLVEKILKSFKLLSVLELKDLNNVLNYCIMHLSSVSIFKLNPTILRVIYYLTDLSKSVPFKYEKVINHGSNNQLLPDDISIPETENDFQSLAEKFANDINFYVPKNWSIITLDICYYTGDLLISKISKYNSPYFIRLNLNRFVKGDSELRFKDVFECFKEIIRQSNESTKSSTTSNVVSKIDRKNWWKVRFSLDLSLKELLQKVSTFWFGGFKALFNDHDDVLFEKFKREFFEILETVLWYEKNDPISLDIDDNIILLFYNLTDFTDDHFKDIFLYLISSLKIQGMTNLLEVDMKKACSHFRSLHEKYKILFKSNQEHLVLIPSAECAEFPWESLDFMRNKSISRVPSVSLLLTLLKENYKENGSSEEILVSKERLYYLINPGGDLLRTEEKFSSSFSQIANWSGHIRKIPEETQLINDLVNSDVYVYLGHGGGENYIRASTLHKECLPIGPSLPPSLLIGCSSGSLQTNGYLPSHGHIYSWLVCGSPMVLVNLWDVTDKDIDKFSSSVFEKWGLFTSSSGLMNICEAVKLSRDDCTLSYLNGASPIVYGLPMYLRQ